MVKILLFVSLFFIYLNAKEEIVACSYTVLLKEAKTSTGMDLGLGRELVNLFSENISIPITMRYFTSIEELHKSAINRECDVIPFIEKTSNKEQHFFFTKPYYHIPIVMATKQGLPFINNMLLLEGKKIAGVRGHSYMKSFAQKYPNIKFVSVASREEGLNLLRREEVFGFLDFAQILNYVILQNNMKDIAITAQFNHSIPISIAVRNDDAKLFKIFEDALLNTKQERLDRLMLDWYSIGYKRDVDYKLLMQISFFILVVAGIFVYWNLQMKEIQEKKEKKQAFLLRQNKLAQMGEMIENIAHQWRQPLAQINSSALLIYAFLDKAKIDNANIEQKLSEIESVTAYMSKTIDDFRNFFHPNKEKEIFFLTPFLEEVLNITKGLLESYDVEVELEVDSKLNLFGYKDELKQVIIFLLNNSIEAFQVKKIKNPKIYMSAEAENKMLLFKIKDNAGGIPEAIADKIFNPYFTTKHQTQGTGLGLFMTKKIIEEGFLGKISLFSQADKSTFIIKIPQAEINLTTV